MKLWTHYHTPRTVEDAVALLTQYQGRARIVAGGTDLLVEMRADGHAPQEALIDITRVTDLTRITETAGTLTIGAGVTHSQIVQSGMLAQAATALVESCGVVGGPQVRNVATLGGNVAHALPAGDGTTSLVALHAEAEVIQAGTQRWLPLPELFLGPGKSLLDPTRDLLLRFRFQAAAAGEATAFKRIMRPQGVALPILGCAVWVKLSPDQAHFEALRVCIAPTGPTPRRAEAFEAALTGQPAAMESVEAAIPTAQASLQPRTSKYRATADYRQEMIAVLLRRTLALALERARTGEAVPEGVGQ